MVSSWNISWHAIPTSKNRTFFYECSPAYKEYTVCVYARLPGAVGEYSYAVDYVAAMYS